MTVEKTKIIKAADITTISVSETSKIHVNQIKGRRSLGTPSAHFYTNSYPNPSSGRETGLSITFTPSKPNTTVLITAFVKGVGEGANTSNGSLAVLFRDDTPLDLSMDNKCANDGNTRTQFSMGGHYLCQTEILTHTTPVTYHVKVSLEGNAPVYINCPTTSDTSGWSFGNVITSFLKIEEI